MVPSAPPGLREGETSLLQDRIFNNEINIAIERTREGYERMTFREALKAAAYDLGNARDVYRCFVCRVSSSRVDAGLVWARAWRWSPHATLMWAMGSGRMPVSAWVNWCVAWVVHYFIGIGLHIGISPRLSRYMVAASRGGGVHPAGGKHLKPGGKSGPMRASSCPMACPSPARCSHKTRPACALPPMAAAPAHLPLPRPPTHPPHTRRFAVGPEGMHAAHVRRYIEVFTLLMVPIIPHTAEHIWWG